MPDYQTMREENQGILYLLLTPFRCAIGIVKVAALILLVILTMTYNQLGWIVGLGHMGYLSRHATADIMSGIPHFMSSSIPPDHSEIFTIDLSSRQKRWTHRYGPGEVAGVAIDPLPYSKLVQPPDACSEEVRQSDPGQVIDDGWFNRTRTVYERKGSRMFEAYVTGVISVSYLRTTITRIKMHMPSAYEQDTAWPSTTTDCEMDPQDALLLPPEGYARWGKTSASVQIPAPTVRMHVISTNGIHDAEMHGVSGLITGMCHGEVCDDGGMEPYVTW